MLSQKRGCRVGSPPCRRIGKMIMFRLTVRSALTELTELSLARQQRKQMEYSNLAECRQRRLGPGKDVAAL
jgi:hypothetical protein